MRERQTEREKYIDLKLDVGVVSVVPTNEREMSASEELAQPSHVCFVRAQTG